MSTDTEQQAPNGTHVPQDNPYGVTPFPVRTASGQYAHDQGQSIPSGGKVNLQSPEEADYYERQRSLYMGQFKFTNVSDLADLDRVLLMEVLIFRWGFWLAQGWDYMMARVDEHALKQNIGEYSRELRLLKSSLGIDKVTRDQQKGESVADYLETLRRRAREFGVHRNHQYERAVNLIFRIRSMVMMHDRTDEVERDLLDLSSESIIDWIRETVIPEWDELDEEFRKNQKIWIREVA